MIKDPHLMSYLPRQHLTILVRQEKIPWLLQFLLIGTQTLYQVKVQGAPQVNLKPAAQCFLYKLSPLELFFISWVLSFGSLKHAISYWASLSAFLFFINTATMVNWTSMHSLRTHLTCLFKMVNCLCSENVHMLVNDFV